VGQIIFHCTNCGTKLSAELDEVGQEFECPKCNENQIVPGGPSATSTKTSPGTPIHPDSSAGAPVIHIPKRKIVLSNSSESEDECYEDEEEELGGTGVALFAIALGTAGLLLCAVSMVWMFITQQDGGTWWMSLLVFLATFLMGLMGLVLAQLARLVVRLADRVSQITEEEEQ